MTVLVHNLAGCSPAPLAHYLKALGILRLVTEQADPQARGWWRDESFHLLTRLDRGELIDFFLHRYQPTPLLSPWNKGSGFYRIPDKGLTPIERSTAPRFAPFREGIAAARVPLQPILSADQRVRDLKDRSKVRKGMTPAERKAAIELKTDPGFKQQLAAADRDFKERKAHLFAPCSRAWRGTLRAWLDAAAVIKDDGAVAFPSLLGSGGNDGRLDFTNNAMQRLGELFALEGDGEPRETTPELLSEALWRDGAPALSDNAIGQFLPGAAGGANSSNGPEGGALINAWDFVLMLEGSIVIQARTTRQLNPNSQALASAPFAVYAHGGGYASPGSEKAARGEQWLPLWAQPSSLVEVENLFGEARLQLGRQSAHRPVDAARAIARLGVARGVRAFTRFGYLERNGQANLAVALGRIDVRSRPHARLIDDIAPWLDRLQGLARKNGAPAHLAMAERRLADAVLAALTHDDTPQRWQAVLDAAVQIETLQVKGAALRAGPIPRLSPGWVAACDDGTSEWRLALALGSAADAMTGNGHRDTVRSHWLPLERGRFKTGDSGLLRDPRVVCGGRNFVADACAIVERRLIDAAQGADRRLNLRSAPGVAAPESDLVAFVEGRTDDDRLWRLARALMALDWGRWKLEGRPITGDRTVELDRAWWVLRLVFLPWPLFDGWRVPADPAVFRRCAAGDGGAAVSLAARRLQSTGIRVAFDAALVSPALARRWAASFVFPIDFRSAARGAQSLQPDPNGVR